MFYNVFTENRRNSNREIIKDSAEGNNTDSLKPPSINVQGGGYVEGVVNVILPLKLYELTIQHRVLAELGELSHFILSVMDKYDLTVKNIEEVTGLPKSTIEQFLTRLFQISCKSTYKKPGSKSKEGNICRPMASFNGHASSTLKSSLKHSSLQGITLLNNNDGNFIDDNKELRMSEQAIKLRVSGKPTGSKALDLIKKASNFGREKITTK